MKGIPFLATFVLTLALLSFINQKPVIDQCTSLVIQVNLDKVKRTKMNTADCKSYSDVEVVIHDKSYKMTYAEFENRMTRKIDE